MLLDSYCAELIGYHADKIEYLRIASHIGIGRLFDDGATVLELNTDRKPIHAKAGRGTAKRLAAYINEDNACSACYAALIHALHHGAAPKTKINIGQGFIGKPGVLGCGNCTSKHDKLFPAACHQPLYARKLPDPWDLVQGSGVFIWKGFRHYSSRQKRIRLQPRP